MVVLVSRVSIMYLHGWFLNLTAPQQKVQLSFARENYKRPYNLEIVRVYACLTSVERNRDRSTQDESVEGQGMTRP